jgi:aminocarboxymuconate-semialdehyde decarboxylase
MRIIDTHFHWQPPAISDGLCKRTEFPRVEADGQGGYRFYRKPGVKTAHRSSAWYDIDRQFEYLDGLDRGQIDVISSMGPFAVFYSELSVEEGREGALAWNEAMAGAQRKFADRFWGTAAVPLVDTQVAIDVMNDAIGRLGLVGVNLPCSVGDDPLIDHPRLEPFYDRVEELDVPLILHPTDSLYGEDFSKGYGGTLHATLGRVVEVSAAATRLILSGIMARHPNLKVLVTHTGGVLPYQAGRYDKNGGPAKLPEPPSTYIKRFYTDLVAPHALGMEFALKFFGVDHVTYGTDYPCWMPHEALELFDELDVSQADREKIFSGNARNLFKLRQPVAV